MHTNAQTLASLAMLMEKMLIYLFASIASLPPCF